jgi:hypothetical protein
MLVIKEKCKVCGKELELRLNTKQENVESDTFYITNKKGQDLYESEIVKYCYNCRIKNKYKKDITID